jgi:hypothetical protein
MNTFHHTTMFTDSLTTLNSYHPQHYAQYMCYHTGLKPVCHIPHITNILILTIMQACLKDLLHSSTRVLATMYALMSYQMALLTK